MDRTDLVSSEPLGHVSPAPLAVTSAIIAIVLACGPGTLRAQQPPDSASVSPRETQPPVTTSPRGALLRALALPGWGHAAIGSHTRGGFYFAAQAATGYTLLRTGRRLTEARERVALRESFLRAQLATEGVTDPVQVEAQLDQDGTLRELRGLQDSREQQREDLIALGIFMLFLSGADAYVSAHLSRFPEPLEVEAAPLGGGRYAVGLRVRLPN